MVDAWLTELERVLSISSSTERVVLVAAAAGRTVTLDAAETRAVVRRALLAQDRVEEAEQALADAEQSLAQLSSASHRAVAWTAQGDLALHRGDDRAAAALFRRAAEALQELKF